MKMFWGMILEPGKSYEQIAESSFHLTMAALEPSNKQPTPNKSTITSVLLETNKTKYILCNLDQQRVLQQPLDCVFTEGEPISFSVNGESKVHLSGYIMPDSDIEDSEDMFDLDGSDESDSEADLMNMAEKRKAVGDAKDGNKKVKFDENSAAAKGDKKQPEKAKQGAKKEVGDVLFSKGGMKGKAAAAAADDDEDDEDDDESMDSEDMNNLLDNFEDDEDDEDDDDDDDESSPEVKKAAKPQGKPNQKAPTPGKQGGGGAGGKPAFKPNQNQTPQGGKKPFQQGGGNKPWSGNKGDNKGGKGGNFMKNQNSGKKGTPQGGKKFGGNSPGGKKPWGQKK